MKKEVLMHIKDICKSFGPTKAVNNVTVDIYKSEIRGLIGENGSGKSTLVSMIAGIQKPDSGTMVFENREYSVQNQVEANKKGISIIVQEMSTLDGLTVAENIFFGHEDLFSKRGIRNLTRMNEKAKEYMSQFGLKDINPRANISLYNFEQRKLIELVKAAYLNPKLVIIDETTTALSQNGRDELYKLIKDLRKQGSTVVFISHDLPEVLELCDTITVFRDGHLIKTIENSSEVMEGDLKRLMVGRELTEKYYREDYGQPISDEVVLSVRNVNLPRILSDVNFDLHRGEILGIGGLSESGMHEIGKVIFGASPKSAGTVLLEEKNIQIKSIKQAIVNDMGYVSKNRDHEALINNASIKDNVCISSLDKLKNGIYISSKKEREFTQKYVEQLNLKMESVEQFISALSGGNKQKVALAKWIARNSQILVLDSPTRGIDVMVKAAIYELMEQLVAQGKSIIMISEEILELIGMCDRLLILKNGKISGEFLRSKDLGEEVIIQRMI